MKAEELKAIFTYHAPKEGQPALYELLRGEAHQFAEAVNVHCPESREKSVALTKIQEAIMWANAAIAIHE